MFENLEALAVLFGPITHIIESFGYSIHTDKDEHQSKKIAKEDKMSYYYDSNGQQRDVNTGLAVNVRTFRADKYDADVRNTLTDIQIGDSYMVSESGRPIRNLSKDYNRNVDRYRHFSSATLEEVQKRFPNKNRFEIQQIQYRYYINSFNKNLYAIWHSTIESPFGTFKKRPYDTAEIENWLLPCTIYSNIDTNKTEKYVLDLTSQQNYLDFIHHEPLIVHTLRKNNEDCIIECKTHNATFEV